MTKDLRITIDPIDLKNMIKEHLEKDHSVTWNLPASHIELVQHSLDIFFDKLALKKS